MLRAKKLVFRRFLKVSVLHAKICRETKEKYCCAQHLINIGRVASVREGRLLGGVCDRVSMPPCALREVLSGLSSDML